LRHRGHALLIGVSYYTSGWDQLPSVAKDLQDLQEGLAPYFQTVDIPDRRRADKQNKSFSLGPMEGVQGMVIHLLFRPRFTDFNRASKRLDGYITGSDTPV